jgi:hypothetical protein
LQRGRVVTVVIMVGGKCTILELLAPQSFCGWRKGRWRWRCEAARVDYISRTLVQCKIEGGIVSCCTTCLHGHEHIETFTCGERRRVGEELCFVLNSSWKIIPTDIAAIVLRCPVFTCVKDYKPIDVGKSSLRGVKIEATKMRNL